MGRRTLRGKGLAMSKPEEPVKLKVPPREMTTEDWQRHSIKVLGENGVHEIERKMAEIEDLKKKVPRNLKPEVSTSDLVDKYWAMERFVRQHGRPGNFSKDEYDQILKKSLREMLSMADKLLNTTRKILKEEHDKSLETRIAYEKATGQTGLSDASPVANILKLAGLPKLKSGGRRRTRKHRRRH